MDRRWIRSIGLENVSFAFESRHFLLGLAVDLAPKRRFEARKVSHFTLRGIQGRSGPFGESMHSTLESISVRNICQMGTKKRLFMGLSHEKYWFFDDPQGTSHEVTLLLPLHTKSIPRKTSFVKMSRGKPPKSLKRPRGKPPINHLASFWLFFPLPRNRRLS